MPTPRRARVRLLRAGNPLSNCNTVRLLRYNSSISHYCCSSTASNGGSSREQPQLKSSSCSNNRRYQVPSARSSTTNILCQDGHPQAASAPEAEESFQADFKHSKNELYGSLCLNIRLSSQFTPTSYIGIIQTAPQTTAVVIQNHTQQTKR